MPKKTTELAVLSARYHTHCHRIRDLNASTLVKLLQSLDVVRKPERFEHFLLVCEADARGRLGYEKTMYPQAVLLRDAAAVFREIDTATIAKNTENKAHIADEITQVRVATMKRWRSDKGLS